MGIGYCRFNCGFGVSDDIHIEMPDCKLVVCGAWNHYMTEHKVLLPPYQRKIVMESDPMQAHSEVMRYRGEEGPRTLRILFVEKTPSGYDHKIGIGVDTEARDRLERLIRGNI